MSMDNFIFLFSIGTGSQHGPQIMLWHLPNSYFVQWCCHRGQSRISSSCGDLWPV